jgi:succinate dehydrogenase / fumarate reductase cytochrome b subunit
MGAPRCALILEAKVIMAQVERPLSPHLQIYKPQISSMLSILHRLTGFALGGGSLLLVWWLVAAAYGPDEFAVAQGFIASWFGRLILLGFTFSFFYHLCNGVRHLFWDIGKGFEVKTADLTGWLALLSGAVLTVLAWLAGYAMRGGA